MRKALYERVGRDTAARIAAVLVEAAGLPEAGRETLVEEMAAAPQKTSEKSFGKAARTCESGPYNPSRLHKEVTNPKESNMLNWFAKRLREVHERNENGEKGFTLIELLVVVIIIGILAAIAIPVFLSQRTKALEAAVQSDLRNLASAESAYSAGANGKFTTDTALLKAEGWRKSAGVNVTFPAASNPAGGTSYCAQGSHTGGGGTFHVGDDTGGVAAGACP